MKQILNPLLKETLDSHDIEIEYLPNTPESNISLLPHINTLTPLCIKCNDISPLTCYLGQGLKGGNSYYALLDSSYEVLVEKEYPLWNSLMTKEEVIKYLYLVINSELIID